MFRALAFLAALALAAPAAAATVQLAADPSRVTPLVTISGASYTVPVPASLPLLALGLAGLILAGRRRRL